MLSEYYVGFFVLSLSLPLTVSRASVMAIYVLEAFSYSWLVHRVGYVVREG